MERGTPEYEAWEKNFFGWAEYIQSPPRTTEGVLVSLGDDRLFIMHKGICIMGAISMDDHDTHHMPCRYIANIWRCPNPQKHPVCRHITGHVCTHPKHPDTITLEEAVLEDL